MKTAIIINLIIIFLIVIGVFFIFGGFGARKSISNLPGNQFQASYR